MSSGESESSDDSDDDKPSKGLAELVGEVANPNRVVQKNKKLKDLTFDAPTAAASGGGAPQALNRKERYVRDCTLFYANLRAFL